MELRKVTQNLLGRLTAMDPATIQGVVRRLMERGLLDRSEDPMDRRTAVLAPTEAGIALIGQGVACAQRSHRAVLSPLTADERRQLLSLLRKIGDPNGQSDGCRDASQAARPGLRLQLRRPGHP